MTNSEQVAYQSMLRDCENSLFGGDVQDDESAAPVHTWIEAKHELPIVANMCWVAVKNVVLCAYQTLLCYLDGDDQWRDASGVLMFRTVCFWQYADVPQCEGVC